MRKRWYDYLWIGELIYLCLGLFNILFAWLGMLFFTIPLLVAIFGKSKAYCNRYCGRGQVLSLLGEKGKFSRNVPPPRFLRSKWFRYGFLAFFMIMFGRMLYSTYRVFAGVPDGHAGLDLPSALAVGAGGDGQPVGGPVRLRLFRRDAHFHRAGAGYYAPVPAPLLVRLLSHGHHDSGDLRTEKSKGDTKEWKRKRRW